MEILLKTKQAGNPVFDFLSIDHEFNKFYKHLIMLVKTKQYRNGDLISQLELNPNCI